MSRAPREKGGLTCAALSFLGSGFTLVAGRGCLLTGLRPMSNRGGVKEKEARFFFDFSAHVRISF